MVRERFGMMNAPQGQEHVVKKSKFTEEQIAFALKQGSMGGCRFHGHLVKV